MTRSLIAHKTLYFIFLMICFSCRKDISTEASTISNFIDCNHKDKCYVLVVPMEGCGGCRSLAIRYIKDSVVVKPAMHYIVSSHNKKLAKIRLGNSILKYNILIDSELFYQKGIIGKYPLLYQLKNGNVLDKKQLEPYTIQQELYKLR